jgi:ATP-binding cassette subfamily A (ABC1) protein 3
MGLLRQVWTLVNKNILIALRRHTISTIFRSTLLPLAYVVFLVYARNLFIPAEKFGVGTPTPVRTLAQGLEAASGGRNNLVFVNNGYSTLMHASIS